MKIVALYSIKGGVGKTSAAVNLAYESARGYARTLLWDLDPQAAATFYFRMKPRVRGGAKGLIGGRRDLSQVIFGTDYEDLHLIPADFSYRKLDRHLARHDRPAKRLAELLLPLSEEYDVLVLDCPPSISLLSEAIFVASDALVVPVIPTTLSLRTLEQLRRHLGKRNERNCELMPFLSMVDRRKKLHRQITQEVHQTESSAETPGGPLSANGSSVPLLGCPSESYLGSQIPYSSLVEQMGLRRAPLGEFAPGSTPGVAFRQLWREVQDRLFD